MTTMMNGFRLPAGVMVSAWLAFAGSAEAGIIIIDDPFSPRNQVVVASYLGCTAGRMEMRLAPLLKKLLANSSPSAPAMAPAIPAVLISQADSASPAHVARFSPPSGRALVVGVAF
jgi:hypothetical protein